MARNEAKGTNDPISEHAERDQTADCLNRTRGEVQCDSKNNNEENHVSKTDALHCGSNLLTVSIYKRVKTPKN